MQPKNLSRRGEFRAKGVDLDWPANVLRATKETTPVESPSNDRACRRKAYAVTQDVFAMLWRALPFYDGVHRPGHGFSVLPATHALPQYGSIRFETVN